MVKSDGEREWEKKHGTKAWCHRGKGIKSTTYFNYVGNSLESLYSCQILLEVLYCVVVQHNLIRKISRTLKCDVPVSISAYGLGIQS